MFYVYPAWVIPTNEPYQMIRFMRSCYDQRLPALLLAKTPYPPWREPFFFNVLS